LGWEISELHNLVMHNKHHNNSREVLQLVTNFLRSMSNR